MLTSAPDRISASPYGLGSDPVRHPEHRQRPTGEQASTLTGLVSRIARRLLALTAVILHNWLTGDPGRRLTAYDH